MFRYFIEIIVKILNTKTKRRIHRYHYFITIFDFSDKRIKSSSNHFNGFASPLLLTQTVSHVNTTAGYYVGVTGDRRQTQLRY